MNLKTTFDPRKVAGYIWKEMALGAISASIAFGSYHLLTQQAALPFAPVTLLGTALAIFLAFRNNSSYGRWVEASQSWQAISTQSRIFGRLIVTFVDAHRHTPQHDPVRARAFQIRMVHRQIAWVHVLRLHLRGQSDWQEVAELLPLDEFAEMRTKQNEPGYLLQRQGSQMYDAMADGTLQGFDSFQLEGALAQLQSQHSACERIKTTPIPRQYDFFTRLFVHIFTVLLPFCLLSLFTAAEMTWLTIPFALLVTFLFTTIEQVGAVNEAPFENRITDVPLSAICNGIERDLLELLGETELPAKHEPRDGYLF